MSNSQTATVTDCLVTRVFLRVDTSNRTFEVAHGPDDLNIPDESFPLRVRVIDDDDGWVPASVFIGSTSVFAKANAYIEKYTDRRVPRQETARDLHNVSKHRASVRITTDNEGVYRFVFDTTDVSLPLVDTETPDGTTTVPDTLESQARREVEETIDI